MSQIVEIPGQGEVEFPDSMGDADIAAAAKKLSAPPPPQEGRAMAALRGAAQGATLGFGDEMEAGWKHLVGGQPYQQTRDQLRNDEANAKSQHPVAYTAGEVGGSLAPMAFGGGATLGQRLLMSAGQGAAQGAGYSDAGDPRSLARDTALGAGVGTLGFGAGEALSGAGRGLARLARSGSAAASAQAAEKAAKEVADKIASATGSLGGEVQKGNRIVENIRRLNPNLSPAEQQAAADLEQRLAASNVQALPGQAGTIATKDAELASLKSGASQALKDRTAELLSTDEAKGQLLRRLLRYGPVAAGSAIGTAVGGPVGSAVGALAGAGSRPMIQSMVRLGKNPAVQKAAFDALGSAAESSPGALLRQLLTRGGAAAATQSLVENGP